MTTTIQPTREARRLHLSHLATTHRAPLSGARPTGVRTRAHRPAHEPASSRSPASRAPPTPTGRES